MSNPKTKRKSILIVEDDRDQLVRYVAMAKKAGLDVNGASDHHQALEILAKRSFDYVLTDIHLAGDLNQNGFEGIQILDYIKQNKPEVTPIAMTSDPKITTYQKVMAKGVSHLFRKPIRTEDELLLYLEFARKDRQKSSALRRNKQNAAGMPSHIMEKYPDGVVIPQDLREMARLVAVDGEAPFVITGETGTGKEELAKVVHRLSLEIRGPMPFIAVNCANIGGDTAVSTLFGHKKGSFTGAEATVNGLIGEADGGILFLDEINTLNLECQQRLLRVLNDGSYQRLGDAQTLYSRFQVIAAANCDLYVEVDKGKFLLDLVSRLTGLAVKLKPLRERLEELPIFVEMALAKVGATIGHAELQRLVKKCGDYYWRGNVRELFQVIRAMVILSGGDEGKVSADHLPVLPGMLAPGLKGAQTFDLAKLNRLVSAEDLTQLMKAVSEDQPLEKSLATAEKIVIESALKRHGTLAAAAEALSTPKSTFSARSRRVGVEIGE